MMGDINVDYDIWQPLFFILGNQMALVNQVSTGQDVDGDCLKTIAVLWKTMSTQYTGSHDVLGTTKYEWATRQAFTMDP